MLYASDKIDLDPEYGTVIQLEKEYAYDAIKPISSLYPEKNLTGIIYFLRALFQKKKLYPLEELCLLLQYQSVLGKNKDLFLEQWFSKLAVDDYSLFYLSELFFAKKREEFVGYWALVFDEYSEMFWVSFLVRSIFQSVLLYLSKTAR